MPVLYDADGSPVGMQYRTAGMAEGVLYTFWFEKNLQGDIVAVYNESGMKIISYTYDAWGRAAATASNMTGTNTYAIHNPFRYRGYYYDSETGLYYLRSRYYNPEWGRFLNADGQVNSGLLGSNLFVYCQNNPIAYIDPFGDCPYHNSYNDDCKICYQERMNAYLAGYTHEDESELFAYKPRDPSAFVKPQGNVDKFSYSDAQTMVTLTMTTFGTSLGFAMTTAFEAGVAGTVGFGVSVPISVLFRWCNPDLKNGQKWVLTGYDVGVGLVGIGLGCALAASPLGMGYTILISVVYIDITYGVGSAIKNHYLNDHKRELIY